MQRLPETTKREIVKLHLQEGRTLRSLSAEYGVSKPSISIWVRNYREECQTSKEAKSEYELMLENRELKRKLEEAKKENDFLKKAAAFFAKEID
jgi:Transposase and inactivated derivatives